MPIYQILSGQPIPPPLTSGHILDVRDVSSFLVFTAQHPEKVHKGRYILCAAYAPEQAIADVLHKLYPEREGIMDRGTPGEGYLPGYGYDEAGKIPRFDVSEAEELWGKQWIGYETMIEDAAKVFEKLL
jgi:nucleoside-diphosphate-sugar epimerase